MKTELIENMIHIQFRYDASLIQKIRGLEGRKWNPLTKKWECPPVKENISQLEKWGFDISPRIKEFLLPKKQKKLEELPVKGMLKELFPFQKMGTRFLEEKNGRAIIADEMGLGKTIQALSYLQLHPEIRPAIIVCPASLKLNWKREIETGIKTNRKIHILEGRKKYRLPESDDIYICNYDIISSHITSLLNLNPQILIIDEAHFAKNRKAQRTKAVLQFAGKIKHIIALTGTPIMNRPHEIFNIISLVAPSLFPNFFFFGKRYCNMKKTAYGWDYSGASNTKELHDLLSSTCMIRRTKEEVLPDLPPKIKSVVPISLSNQKDYNNAENHFLKWLLKEKGKSINPQAEAIVQIEYLKQICIEGKIKQIIEWIEDYLEQKNKLVLMTTHKKTVEVLSEYFHSKEIPFEKLTGGMSVEEKEWAVNNFRENPNIRVFIGNIQAAGTGITLTAATDMAILELPLTPGILDQAEDRIHRIGQKESCGIYYFIAEGTIEEEILKLIDEKRKIITEVLDGKDVEDKSILSELLNRYYERREEDEI